MWLSGHSLKQHSDYAVMDYLLQNGLGEAFKTRLSRLNHNLVWHKTIVECQALYI